MAGNDANAILMLHGDGANGGTTFTDSELPTAKTCTAAGASITTSTTQKKFGTASINATGTPAEFLACGSAGNFNFPGDFTVDFWIFPTSATINHTPFSYGYVTANGLMFQSDGSNPPKYIVYVNSSAIFTTTVGYALNAWHHFALERSGTTVKAYLDGVANGSATSSISIGSGQSFTLRLLGDPAGVTFIGYIDEVRVSNVSRYGLSNFTPETVPYSLVAIMSCTAASYSVAGVAANFGRGLHIIVTTATYAVAGVSAGLVKGYHMAVTAAAFTVTGVAAILDHVVSSASKFKNRISEFVLQKLRVTPPTLED